MENLGEIIKPIIKVRVKTWDEMVEKYGWYCEGTINLGQFGWHKELEKLMPEDRIIEVIEKYKCNEYHMVSHLYGISQDAVAEIIEPTFEVKSQADGLVQLMSKVDLDSPEHPANQELLPELEEFNRTKARESLLEFCDKATLTNNNLKIFKQIQNKSHLCHYTKFQLDFDINTSIRFIHAFEDRPELVGKFIFKHHEDKLFSIIEPQLAEHFIKTQCSSEAEEFINRYVGGGKGKKYRRIKVTENSLTKFFES